MRFQETIDQGLIRFFIHPFFQNKPIDFRTFLRSATRVLISCPAGGEMGSCGGVVGKYTTLFPRKDVRFLCPDVNHPSSKKSDRNTGIMNSVSLPDIHKMSLWNFRRSKSLEQLHEQRFDVLIDLDPDFNLLNVYLCRFIQPPVRVGFSKPFGHHYYNIQYNGSDESYAANLEGLFNFLHALVS